MHKIVKRTKVFEGCIWDGKNINDFATTFPECSFKESVDQDIIYVEMLRSGFDCSDWPYQKCSESKPVGLTKGDVLIRDDITGELKAVNACEFKSQYIIVPPNTEQIEQ